MTQSDAPNELEEQKTKWISVKDQLPKGLQEVLICYFGLSNIVLPYITIGVYLPTLQKWRLPYNTIEATDIKATPSQIEYQDQHRITHWMLLPEPPKV